MNNVTAAMTPPQSDLGATVTSVLVAARMRVWNPVTPDDGFASVGSVDGIHIAKRNAGDYDDFGPLNLSDPRTFDPRTSDPRTSDPRTSDPRTSDPRTSDPRSTSTSTDPALLGPPPLW